MKVASRPFTLAQLARAVGVSIEDVQSYRDHGLLQPARGQSGDRAYHREHIDRLHFIARVSPNGMLTCNDLFKMAWASSRSFGGAWDLIGPMILALESLLAGCPKVGRRKECPLLATLAA